MRLRSFFLCAVAVTACAVVSFQPSAADPIPIPKDRVDTPESVKPINWKDDPVCQMVFFAVLEGLYTDGIPAEVVDSIVPPKKTGDAAVKTSFVIECPLCHPTFEALRLYQQRPSFADDAKRDTFGKGLDAKVVADLKSPTAMTRLQALQPLVKTWVERKLTSMRLSPEEKAEWEKKIGERSRQGKAELSNRLGKDEDYKGWSTYWGCAACNGSVRGCSAVKVAGKKE